MAASIHLLRPCASEAHSGHSSLGLDGSSAPAGVAVPFEDCPEGDFTTGLLIGLLLTLAGSGIVGFCVTLAGI